MHHVNNIKCPNTGLGAFLCVVHSINTVEHSFMQFKGRVNFPLLFLTDALNHPGVFMKMEMWSRKVLELVQITCSPL